MPDNPRKRGKADRIRIAVSQRHEVRHWCAAFGITQERLREAVREVGPMVPDVKLYLIEQIERAK